MIHGKRALLIPLLLLWLGFPLRGAPAAEPSLCHAFVDYDFIWTLELIRTRSGTTPILNVITLSAGEWEVQPSQIHVEDESGTRVPIENFSFDSGDPENPYKNPYLKIRGGDFAGLDLVGDFDSVEALSLVQIELAEDLLTMQPMDCNAFEELLDKVSRLEMGSGNSVAAFQVLNIQLLGDRQAR